MKLSSASDAIARDTDAVTRLLQQQTELMEQMRRNAQHEGADAMTPRSNNETMSAILARQTDILDCVANNAGTISTDTRVKLPTIKLPKFDGKIEDWQVFSDSF